MQQLGLFFVLLLSIGSVLAGESQGFEEKHQARMIEDFEAEDVLERVGASKGVTLDLTQKDVVSGKQALEVRVAPYSEHKNSWPYVSLVYPKIINPPLDLTHYSKISMTLRNVTEGLARIRVQGSTLPYNDGGRNFSGESFLIPGGTSWVCDLPAERFTYLGSTKAGNQVVHYNDPSNVQLIFILFPANETNAIYRIDEIQALYDPALGSPGEKLQAAVLGITQGYRELKQKINWGNIDEPERQVVEKQYAQLGQTIHGLSQAHQEGLVKGFQGEYAALKREVEDATRKLGELLLADKKDYFVWEIDPYTNIVKDEVPNFENAELEKIEIQMAQNEFRDHVFMVSACSEDIKLEVECQTDASLPVDAILVQETWYLENRLGEETGDAVYPLTGAIAIPKKESRQIRLRFNNRYASVKPGQYTFTIHLHDLNSGVKKTIPGKLKVWDFQLPSHDILSNDSYAELNNCEFSGEELTAKAVAHMKMYGLNQVFIHPIEMPRPVVDADGNLLRFDSTAFENRMRWIQKGWQSAPGTERLKYHLGVQMINTFYLDRPDIDYTKASMQATPKWKVLFPKWYAYLKETIRRLGIAEDDLILVLNDEPSESKMVREVIPLARAIKEIDPKSKILCNTSNTLTDPVKTQEFYHLIDIYQPHLPEIKTSPQLLDWVRSSGKALETYQCLNGFNQKNKNPYAYYRVYGWDLVKYGMTGAGLWTYCAQGTNPWENPNGGMILIFKHPTKKEVVHSRRYEMFREGIDDYRYVAKLREVAKTKGPQAEAEAEALIRNALADITSDVSDTTRCETWRLRIADEILKWNPSSN